MWSLRGRIRMCFAVCTIEVMSYNNVTDKEIQAEIEALPQQDFARLRHWFLEKDWGRWDRQVEMDAATGKLDFLLDEAFTAKEQGMLPAISRLQSIRRQQCLP